MIISHRHRYVFVELPLTGSTSIAKELRDHYAGFKILDKHSTYLDFLRQASPTERSYFVFSCVRNPLDAVASRFQKVCNDRGGHFSRSIFPGPSLWKLRNNLQYRMRGRGFGWFFRTFYWLPYSDTSCLAHKRLDCVLRFEDLGAEFSRLLERLGLPEVQPLPHHHSTPNKRPFASYYDSPSLRARARRVFGPYLEEWGYTLPDGWGPLVVTAGERWRYRCVQAAHRAYWTFLTRWRGGEAL